VSSDPALSLVRFGILGPLLVVRGTAPIPITAGRQRTALAVLLLNAERRVSTDTLIDELWGEQPPASARNLVATYVWRLRGLLGSGPEEMLIGESTGYRLVLGDAEFDLSQFRERSARGLTFLENGDARAAATVLRSAVDLWRGDVLADVSLQGELAHEASVITEHLLDTAELCIEAELALGRHAALLSELHGLTERHPERERFVALHMTALQHAGRPSEAIAVFLRARTRLSEQLGIEPGPRLRAVYQSLLRDRGSVGARPFGRRPAQLPAADQGFHGRESYFEILDAHSAAAQDVPLIVNLVGPSGIGKTSLAVQWAHRVRGGFPDGQLYAELGGTAQGVHADPASVLARFLRALGMHAADIPTDPAEAAALYRTELAHRSMLTVLDDAASSDAIDLLLPGASGSAVLITSREPLRELAQRHGVHMIRLGPLESGEARALLTTATRSVGSAAVHGRPEHRDRLDELAALCARRPLPLRLAAAHLAEHPDTSPGALVSLAREAHERYGPEQAAVRIMFEISYQALPDRDAHRLRLLGLLTGASLSGRASAALFDCSPAEAERTLERLARSRLVYRRCDGSYAVHALLQRRFGDAALDQESAEARDAALDRWFDWYLRAADAADRLIDPHRYREPLSEPAGQMAESPTFTGLREAAAWLDEERTNLRAAAFHAVDRGRPAYAWQLAWALYSYFDLRKPWMEWFDTYRLGLACSRSVGDEHAEALMMYGLGMAHYYPQQFPEALDCFRRALRLHRGSGDRRGEGTALNCIGNGMMETARFDAAVDHYQQALAIQSADGNRRDEGVVLNNLSEVYTNLSRFAEAEVCAELALTIHREVDNRRTEIFSLCHLANARWRLRQDVGAEALLREALDQSAEIGYRHGRAWALVYLGQILEDQGRDAEAREAWLEAAELFTAGRDPHASQVHAWIHASHRRQSGPAADSGL
jgi:DNA-binding SARP family transcriptional activator/tetratricopeptide (TPR) repeat protein